MKKISLFIIIFFSITTILVAADDSKKSNNKEYNSQVSTVDLEWPVDIYPGFANYAQELVFHKERGLHYLEKAKKYYTEGYNIIKQYVVNPESHDPYLRNPYKVEVGSVSGLSVKQDFADAEYYFTLSLNIVAHYVQWDPDLTKQPLYKSLVQNSFRNLIYVCTYNGNFDKALKYVEEYKKFNPQDMDFVNEWEARILGNIVKLHEKYDWAFTGKLSALSLKKKHRDLLVKIINEKYKSNPQLRDELLNRIYPECVIKPTQKNNTSDNGSSSASQ